MISRRQLFDTKPSKSHTPLSLLTDSKGRIPLPNDWAYIFNTAAQHFQTLYLQTRHPHARIVTRFTPQTFERIDPHHLASADSQGLILRPNASTQIWARIQNCHCCGSPGRIEFRNQFNYEFLQLCAPRECPASDWARYLIQLEAHQSSHSYPPATSELSKVPQHAKALPFHPSMLATIISLAAEEGATLVATIVTEEQIHRRDLSIDSIESDEETLELFSESASAQLHLTAVRQLYLSNRLDGEPVIHALSQENRLLLSIEPSFDPLSCEAFTYILQDLVPELF